MKIIKVITAAMLILILFTACSFLEADPEKEPDKMNFNGTWSFTLPGYDYFPDTTGSFRNFTWDSFDAVVHLETVDYSTKEVQYYEFSGHFERVYDPEEIPWYIKDSTLDSDRVFKSQQGKYIWFLIEENIGTTQIAQCSGPPSSSSPWYTRNWIGTHDYLVPKR